MVHDAPEARLRGGDDEQQTHRVCLGHQSSLKVRFLVEVFKKKAFSVEVNDTFA